MNEEVKTTGTDDAAVPIVGIGSSAGGVEALKEVIDGFRPGVGACYVVIQHLAPGHESILHDLLDRQSRLPVMQIGEGEPVRPDTILVVPPGKAAALKNDRIVLTDRGGDGVFLPIDIFFRSLARERGRAAYCVILSGTGTDGTAGLREIKSAGGVAIVQEREDARFPGMPDSAVATGLVDLILPSREVGTRLRTVLRHRRNIGARARTERTNEIEATLPRITAHLARITDNDFSEYKHGTLVRRIERRMSLLGMNSVEEFAAALEEHEDQAAILASDFLIGVTRFFRDPEVFEKLTELAINPILDRDEHEVRAWVPGCSTGEEAFTIAILFLEALRERGERRPLQVFGTDIDMSALLAARFGEFSDRALADMNPDRRDAFFQRSGDAWCARPELREACVFAPHNLLQDPPFSRLDLISCRNMLIYLKADLQAQVFPRFHFSLRPGGMLLLGPSETLAGNEGLFRPVDKQARIFRRDDSATSTYSALSELRPAARIGDAAMNFPPAMGAGGGTVANAREARAQQAFLRVSETPFALVSGEGNVLYVSPRMSRFVDPAHGVPTTEIDGYLLPALRVPVRIALAEAAENDRRARAENIVVEEGERPRVFDVSVSPLPDDDQSFLLTLAEVRAVDAAFLDAAVRGRATSDRHHLEVENVRLRRQVETVTREHETSGQELKSSNEELMSMNEELQSFNEELETSREELQSINEELETVNAELRENNRQLMRANSDLKNLFEATDVAVLFLDRAFTVRSFTPSTTQIFSIKSRDVGRPIFDLTSRVDYPELRADAAKVDGTLQPVEREVRLTETGETFLLRMRPYRTVDDRIDGYVLSFVDITNRKNAEETLHRHERELAERYAELENLYDTTPVGLSLMDRDLRWVRINQMLADINGFPIGAHVGKRFEDLLPDLAGDLRAMYQRIFQTGEPSLGNPISTAFPKAPGEIRHFRADFYPIRVDGEVNAVGTCVTDVTEQKRLMEKIADSEARMASLFDASPVFIATTEGPRHVVTYSNPANDRLAGRRDILGKPLLDALPELGGQGVIERFDAVFQRGEPQRFPELPTTLGTGETARERWFSQTIEPVRDGGGRVAGTISFAYDITDQVMARKQVEGQSERRRLLLGELQHRVKNTLATIRAISRMLLPGSPDPAAFHRRLSERLDALARTHDLLTGADWSDLDVARIVGQEVSPYALDPPERVTVTGDEVMLDSHRATSFGMAVHELMTNAIKHGALSNGEGTVTVTTTLQEGRATVTWLEEGGPPVPAEREAGFGTFVLDRVLASDLGAEVEADWRPEGLRYRIAFDVSEPS